MNSVPENPTPAPVVKSTLDKGPAKFFQFVLDDTKNRHGQNLALDVEYYVKPAADPGNGDCDTIVIQTLSIRGHDMSKFLDVYTDLSPLRDEIETAIAEHEGDDSPHDPV